MIGHQGFEITYRTSSGELQLSFSCFVKFQKYLTFIFFSFTRRLREKKKLRSAFSAFKRSWKNNLKTYIDGLKNDLKSPQNAKSSSSLNQDEPKLYKV